jgi:hypothetical protein
MPARRNAVEAGLNDKMLNGYIDTLSSYSTGS